MARKRSRIAHEIPYKIRTITPNFTHINIDIILEVRYVSCFDFIWNGINGIRLILRVEKSLKANHS